METEALDLPPGDHPISEVTATQMLLLNRRKRRPSKNGTPAPATYRNNPRNLARLPRQSPRRRERVVGFDILSS